MPVDSSSRLDVAMSSNAASLSMLDLERMLGAVELLSEMLRAVDPNDQDAVNDEIIVELVNQCRLDQKKILSLVSSLRYVTASLFWFSSVIRFLSRRSTCGNTISFGQYTVVLKPDCLICI